jgi:uncharacterized protein DUF2855
MRCVPELRVRRDDFATCELAEGEQLRDDLADGEAQLLVERFALSANNITYATLGDRLGYWRLFPAPDGWGHIPAWGYARVVASRSPALAEGRRVFGLVPMGRHVTVRPRPHPLGFVDGAPHRAELSRVYNQYLSVEEQGADAALVMRPLFGTSVLLDLMLSEAEFNGAQTVVLTSASSKTAYGLAHLLRERPVQTIGLTSPTRPAWVEDLGLYDRVLAYDELTGLRVPGRALLVDFAGDRALVRRIHEQLESTLVRGVLVGFTHRQAETDGAPCPALPLTSSSRPMRWHPGGGISDRGTPQPGGSSPRWPSGPCASSESPTATSSSTSTAICSRGAPTRPSGTSSACRSRFVARR